MSDNPIANRLRQIGGRWLNQARTVGAAALVLVFLTLLVASVLVLPRHLLERAIAEVPPQSLTTADRLKAENDLRTTLLQGLAGLVLLAGAIATWRQLHLGRQQLHATQTQMQSTLEQSSEELRLNREGQVTERFTRAVDQLGHAALAVRLGGIYALERIARDSPKDQGPITEILTAFVREQSVKTRRSTPTPVERPKASAETQAIVTVLGRRRVDPSEPRLDFTGADLRGVYLEDANLEHAIFLYARLDGALFDQVRLSKALLGEAHLEKAHLQRTDLAGADLSFAHLQGASLVNVRFDHANLSRTHFEGTYFSQPSGLTHQQLEDAFTDSETQLPPSIVDTRSGSSDEDDRDSSSDE